MGKLNSIRYVTLLILVIFVSLWYLEVSGELIAILFLILVFSNFLDDIIFYYGSCLIKSPDTSMYGMDSILSPVNGTITDIKTNRSILQGIQKRDVILGNLITEGAIVNDKLLNDDTKYTQITIFLNKFNKHTVSKCGWEVASISYYNKDGELKAMLTPGELIGDNYTYLDNSFYLIEFTNRIKMILTMDKYVSRFEFGNENLLGFILRGSQCDLYIPNDVPLFHKLKYGDEVNIHECIAISKLSNCKLSSIDINRMRSDALGILRNSKINIFSILLDNIKKSAMTFSKSMISIPLILSFLVNVPILNELLLAISWAFLFYFIYDRFFTNLLYSLVTSYGLKSWIVQLSK